MVVLTLHRDTPLSPAEIHALPGGCFPVLSDSDVVARAELNLPMAHVARFAAAMARAIPDADFSAEHRPTARGVRVLEAGALSDPLWAYEPALTFRVPMPDAHTLASAPGTPRRPAPIVVSTVPDAPHPEVDRDEDIGDDESGEGEGELDAGDWPTAPLPSFWQERELRAEVGLDELVRQLDGAGHAARDPDDIPPPLSGVQLSSEVPPEMLAMLQRMQQLNGGPLEEGADDGWPVPPPRPDVRPPAPPPRRSSAGGADAWSAGGTVPRPGPVPQEDPWALLDAGEERMAEGAFLLQGNQPDDLERLAPMFGEASGARVALACQVARWLDWPGGVGLLQRAASHPESEARLAAVQALALHGGPEVEPILYILSRDADARVGSLAQRALKRISGRSRL